MIEFSNIFVFVVASFNDPVYLEFIKLRKQIFKRYGIPHMFVYDITSNDYDQNILKNHDLYESETDYFVEKEIVQPPLSMPSIANPHLNPHMVIKFLKAIRLIDVSKYQFILRVNLSTYINFPLLLNYLNKEDAPTSPFIIGPRLKIKLPDSSYPLYRSTVNEFISGTCMIFSPDIIKYLQDYDLTNTTELYIHNDDIVLSHIVKQMNNSVLINIPMVNWCKFKKRSVDLLKSILVRCKDNNDRNQDTKKWKYLMKYVDRIN